MTESTDDVDYGWPDDELDEEDQELVARYERFKSFPVALIDPEGELRDTFTLEEIIKLIKLLGEHE